jgi:putative MATE family efflux protein
VARRTGEKEKEKAGIAASHAIILSVLISVPFAILGIFYSKELLTLMGADAWALEQGYSYTQWMLGCNMVIVLIFVINAIFRGAGDAAIAMRVLIIANTINIFLDPALINGWGFLPTLGVEGAAIATNIGRGVGVLIQLWFLFKGGKKIRITLDQFKLQKSVLWNIIKTSLGGIGQMIISMTSWIFLVRILSDISNEAVAGSTIVVRLLMFTLMPAWGLSNAAATLVGQYLGAQKPALAESSVWKIGIYNMFFLIVVSLCFFFFNEELIGIFSDDAEVIRIGAEWLQILSYSYPIYGWWMVSVQAFNGAGDTQTPTLINVVFFWLLQIPLAYFLALQLDWAHSGVFWAVLISETSLGLTTILLFKRGKWKTMSV